MPCHIRTIACLSIACLPSLAIGQVGYSHLSLRWMEVFVSGHNPVPNPNGILEPGEAARVGISVEFTPVGTTFPNGPGTQTVAGFAFTGFLLGSSGVGSWSDQGVAPGFQTHPLSPVGFNVILQSVWQPQPPLGSIPVPTNPIPWLWSVVWAPAQYSTQSSVFDLHEMDDQYPQLFMKYGTDPQGNPLFAWTDCNFDFGPGVSIPIAPAPPIATPLFLALLATHRRPRRSS